MKIRSFVEKHWYAAEPGPLKYLKPLESWYKKQAEKRRRQLTAEQKKVSVPVVVVGNITVGGTGKTPLLIALVRRLRHEGIKVAVVSRGYGRKNSELQLVNADCTSDHVGDEPLEIFLTTGCDVWVADKRMDAIHEAINHTHLDLIISDDGLQHYAMARDVEIAVIGPQALGNKRLLPVGPLRESEARLSEVDFVFNRSNVPLFIDTPVFHYESHAYAWVNLHTGERQGLDFKPGEELIAYAGIGLPQRFFDELTKLGLSYQAQPRPDHHRYHEDEFEAGKTYVMTAKDAVKCRDFNHATVWYLELELTFSEAFYSSFIEKLSKLSV